MLPALLHSLPSQASPADRTRRFYNSVASLLEAWIQRCASPHTQRAYRADILTFVRFLGLAWPEQSARFLEVTVSDVQAYRDWLHAQGAAPKTLNRRISSLSGFYRYLGACAAELRLPVHLPNPAHSQFIARHPADPRMETQVLSGSAARHLLTLPAGPALRKLRDQALLALFLYTGIRLSTACHLRVEDFRWDGAGIATLRLQEKGGRYRTIGIHHAAAQAVRDYLDVAGVDQGPLFRPLSSPRGQALRARPMHPTTVYLLLLGYLRQLPGAVRGSGGGSRCLYTPHSLRATTATLLLQSGVDIAKVQELLGHRHITTTQIYDKRQRSVAQSASHDIPL